MNKVVWHHGNKVETTSDIKAGIQNYVDFFISITKRFIAYCLIEFSLFSAFNIFDLI